MTLIIGYIVIGIILAWGIIDRDGRRAITVPTMAIFIIGLWPLVVVMLIPRIRNIKFRNRVLWRRK